MLCGAVPDGGHLGETRDVAPLPAHAKLEVLVRVKPAVAGALSDLDDYELRWLERREPNNDVHDTHLNIVLGRRLFVALLEAVVTDPPPQTLVVWLEHDPPCGPIERLLDGFRQATDWDTCFHCLHPSETETPSFAITSLSPHLSSNHSGRSV